MKLSLIGLFLVVTLFAQPPSPPQTKIITLTAAQANLLAPLVANVTAARNALSQAGLAQAAAVNAIAGITSTVACTSGQTVQQVTRAVYNERAKPPTITVATFNQRCVPSKTPTK